MNEPLPVIHLVSAMPGAGDELWGKERAIATLMRAQRDSGAIDPQLLTFAPCALQKVVNRQGFTAAALDSQHRTFSGGALLRLRRYLKHCAPAVLHTHGYKANLLGRIARTGGSPMRALVSTCHGWIDESPRTRFYNRLDRASAFVSDAVTVPNPAMLARFPRVVHGRFVANGIADRTPSSHEERLAARASFGLPADRMLAGVLGRVETAKGLLELVSAARQAAGLPIQWIVAGSGPLENHVRSLDLPNVKCLGYVADSERYLDALDLYVQASHSEGLSLALLEAMRARLPIVATRVGATETAVRDMREALLVQPGDANDILDAVRRLMNDRGLAAGLASAARARFEQAFTIERQHHDFLDIYRSCDRMQS